MARPFPKRNRQGFWEKEYRSKDGTRLTLSDTPSEDLQKFCRHVEREHGRLFFNPHASAVDLGCGNGRNLIYLSQTYGMKGLGLDTSFEAINHARARTTEEGLPLTFEIGSIADPIPLPDASQTVVLDMMASHVLTSGQREILFADIARVLRPGGWFFFKTFLLDEDLNAERMLREHPGTEPGSYIHPEIGIQERVVLLKEIPELFEPRFFVHEIKTSHRHRTKDGRANKRRSVTVWAQKA
ncbi:class I SAM-dependent methyltransferase [Candidatus Kaiserbacteria bacterium]|nr:class I SAM-dependent methyltransferase [Candidatus Kaiserbacteria bacterium]